MWEPAKGRKQGRKEGNDERKEGNDEGKEGTREGGKLTDEINERPCACDIKVGELLPAIHYKISS